MASLKHKKKKLHVFLQLNTEQYILGVQNVTINVHELKTIKPKHTHHR